jgi:Kef-type K+ transport system membrane component KefB
MAEIFTELALLMILVFALSVLASKVKQPLLIAYIATGLLAGPYFLNLIKDTASYESFSHIGVALLLFIVGLHLNLKLIKEVGWISLVTGVGQIVFTTLFGYLIGLALGISHGVSLLMGFAFAFSSTIIVIKLLTDTGGIDKLYGKISIGFLLIQDLFAVFALMVVGSLANVDANTSMSQVIVETLLFGGLSLIGILILAKLLNRYVLKGIAKTKELLFIFVIAWCFGISVLFDTIGFSLEIGALIAGVLLASSPYQHELSARIKPLRDFFIVLFFVFLGTQLIPLDPSGANTLANAWTSISPILDDALIFSLFVLIGNPIIVLVLGMSLGYSSRTSFFMGLIISQISEFSLILALLANQAGLLTLTDISLVTLVAVITITCSTYLIANGEKLFKLVQPLIKKYERKNLRDKAKLTDESHDIVIFGYNRIGHGLLNTIVKKHQTFLVIDYDPEVVRKLNKRKINAMMGDASNPEFLSELDLHKTSLVISTIPDVEANAVILKAIEDNGIKAIVILTAHHNEDALELYEMGADYVIIPHFLGGSYASTLIEEFDGKPEHFLKEKISHINELHRRRVVEEKHR